MTTRRWALRLSLWAIRAFQERLDRAILERTALDTGSARRNWRRPPHVVIEGDEVDHLLYLGRDPVEAARDITPRTD